ncbi:MAG: hypothetical protein JJE30_01975 [Desulfuromonadales bacterium]|nr:hypothetical protein [Desulfuromonadales bacterium]
MVSRQTFLDYFPCREAHAIIVGTLRSARIIVLAVIISLPAGTGFSFAGEEPATELAPTAESAPWPGPVPWLEPVPWPGPVPWSEPALWPSPVPSTGYFKAFGKTMDKTHAMLERNILKQTVRFDNYFGSVKPEILRQTSYVLRWRNSIRAEQGSNLNFGSSLLANFALPKISNRLQLFIAGENEPGLATQSLPKDPGNPGFDRTTPNTHFANSELRYELIRNPALNLFLGTGVRLQLPFEVFARSRIQYLHNFSDVLLMRTAETFFVKNTDLFGETTELSLERLLGENTLLRWAGAGTASKEIDGLEWGSELSLFRQFTPKDAITLKGGIFGNTAISAQLQNYLLLASYRRNFLRSWLFYELEPQVSWPKSPDGSQQARFAFTFRLEVVFKGTTAY